MRPVPALLVGLLLFLAALGPAGAGGAAGAGGFLVVAPSPGQRLAIFDRPGGTVVARAGRSEFGGPVVAGVVAREGPWVGVTTELLPNRRVGWVDTRNGVVVSRVEEALRVHLSARRLDIFRAGTLVRRFTVAVGASSSPTPTGRYAVAEKLPGARFGPAFGCCILGLTAHQPHPPRGWSRTTAWFVAVHGGGGIGAAVSAGCVHLPDDDLRYLMRTVPLGTPVFTSPFAQ
jgi:lipoprotein-anchoring transpeptidase ErfK/SrfK